jgi:transcriptional regulator with XRE-family HTH domain
MDLTLHMIMDLMWSHGEKEIDFCNAIGINRSAVSDWKSGKLKSYMRHLDKIAEHFGVSVEELKNPKETKKNSAPEGAETSGFSERESEIFALIRELPDKDKAMLLELVKRLNKEAVEI